jgi:hypothetical protein
MRVSALAAVVLFAAAPAWAELKAAPDRSGAYAIDLPAEAHDQGQGGSHTYVAKVNGRLYVFAVVDYDNPSPPEVELAADVANFIKGAGAEQLSEHGVYFRSERGQILPAMSFTAQSGDTFFQGLFVMDRGRVYSLSEGIAKAQAEHLDFDAWRSTFHVLAHPH